MDNRIVQFISALRASGVRVSLAESADAFRAIEELGVKDLQHFKTSLRTTLIKDNDDVARFEELFPLFFTSAGETPQMQNPTENMSPEEASMLAQALRQFTEQLRRMLQKMLEGKPLSKQELDQLAGRMNMDQMKDPRYQEWLANRMEQAMQFKAVQEAMEELMEMLRKMGMDGERLQELREMMEGNQQAIKDQIRKYVGERIAENLSEENPHDRLDDLYDRPFDSLTEEEMQLLRREVRRLAAALRTRLALRLKRARSGQLDFKGTLRANLKHGNVPIQLKMRDRVLKPKIVVLCDLSTSMRHVSELMLSMLYAIQDQISKTHAFAYIDRLEYISGYFQTYHQPADAVKEILRKMPSGHYNTDLGFSLENFQSDFMDTVDYRTTFIVVGDGRNNYNDPGLRIFNDIARRSRSTIWLNPEEPSMWGRGDSDMLKYASLCKRTFYVSNLTQLAEAIDHLLLAP
jgi:uncharacterized protein with von Willebrand factor type A (vWA) domain